jgi:uncharacterized protein YbjT (DUF2867 family)
MHVVTGATGNTGRIITQRLLDAGKPVRVIGRSADRLRGLANAGADPVVASLEDSAALDRALRGAKTVYAMTPPDYTAPDAAAYQKRVGESIAGAIRRAGVPHVVHLSSIGAQNRTGAGPVSGLGRQEERLDAIPSCNVLHLRAAFFMENLFAMLPMIREGMLAAPLPPDVPSPWIATCDVGAAAAAALLALDFQGKQIRELHGQRDLTWNEVAEVVGRVVGRPELRFVRVPFEAAQEGFVQMGVSLSVAAAYMEMYEALNDGRMRPLESRSRRNTTPTSIEQFATALEAALRS